MNVKKIGRAVADLENELWSVHGRTEKFHMNLRLISAQKELKNARAVYTKIASKGRPPLKRPNKRIEYLRVVEIEKKALHAALKNAYAHVMEQSFEYPIPLWKDKDWGKKMEWRYMLYQGVIYGFDRAGYRDEEMISAIQALTK
ncbi:MAG: hypothetical protein A2Y02_03620 [Omnitrophica bacterium GWA2_52_12]|nr:MAG: hypothetical protein A2Y02_03620 [Omnitrophica bacterium GWA2_52_12]